MIDFDALSALAASALTAHCPDHNADSALNGCSHPEQVANYALDVRDSMTGSSGFAIGFDFALRLGAMLALDPLHCPDLKDMIKTYAAEAREQNYNSTHV